jgi:hypothetical protein
LEKLTNDARFNFIEHFTIQPLEASVPKDFIEDFQENKKAECNQLQRKKLVGLGEDLFQKRIDVMAFPNLFPDGKNYMRDMTRKFYIRNSEYMKCRLLSRHPQFLQDIQSLFHNFQVQELSYFCNSIGHMLRIVRRNQNASDFMDRLKIEMVIWNFHYFPYNLG